MNQEALILLTLTIGFTLFAMQRAEPARRKQVRNFAIFIAMLTIVYIWWRDALMESLVALGVSLLFNGIFWVLIGRYNPVGSSDEIRVLGMDD